MLTVTFDDGVTFALPCEYLRVFSKAAEVRTMDQPVTGKEMVNIERLEPQGQYAIRIAFDDGHDTGIYSWDTLYALGAERERNWAEYLEALRRIGYDRREPEQGEKKVKLLYFSWLAQKLRRESEELVLPPGVTDVGGLLAWLGRRRLGAAPLFDKARVRVTLNKQFSDRGHLTTEAVRRMPLARIAARAAIAGLAYSRGSDCVAARRLSLRRQPMELVGKGLAVGQTQGRRSSRRHASPAQDVEKVRQRQALPDVVSGMDLPAGIQRQANLGHDFGRRGDLRRHDCPLHRNRGRLEPHGCGGKPVPRGFCSRPATM